MRVVHYRDPSLGAVVIVVTEPKSVSDLMRGKLADARERGLIENFRALVPEDVGRKETFENHVILTVAERAERHGAFDNLARAGIGNRAAGAPAARRAVHPVDHVVANVHGVGVGGQHGDFESVAETSGFKRLVPPTCAFDQRLLHILRRARVYPVFDGLHRLTHLRAGIFLHEAVTADETLLHWFADGHAV